MYTNLIEICMTYGTYAHKKPEAKGGIVSCERKKTKIVIEKRKIKVLLCKMTKIDEWLIRSVYRK